jgi:Tfp pilus assembly protein PilN
MERLSAMAKPAFQDARRLLEFGSGVGLAIGATDLEVVVARVRPLGVRVLGRLAIAGFDGRPAAEWGAEYSRFLKSAGSSHLSATVLLPRRDVVVRLLALPGVTGSDLEGAIRLQIDTLHPYGDEDVVWGWSPLPYGNVLIGIARRAAVERYMELFTAAGIAVASFTFPAAVLHAAARLSGHRGAAGFVAASRTPAGAVEVYGESPSRPVFSAEFEMAPERAAALALAELRLPPETTPIALEALLPRPAVNPVENDLSRNALPYATALAGACPQLAPSANVLPRQYRRSRSRALIVPTAVLAGLALAALIAMIAWPKFEESRYLKTLDAEIARIEPSAARAAALDRETDRLRARTALIDEFRLRTRADLDSLNELTRLVEPPAWTNAIELTADTARISGEAPQAAPLLKILDSSRLFRNSQMDMDQHAPAGTGEVFQIHTTRGKP